MLNLRRLAYFLAVVDEGTVTAAAELCGIAQPSLSRQLRTLEHEIGLPLLRAEAGRLALTPSGRALEPIARQLVSHHSYAIAAIERLRTGYAPRLHISSTAVTVRRLLNSFIASDDARAHPEVNVSIHPRESLPASLYAEADCYISSDRPSMTLHSVELGRISIRAYVGPQHPGYAGRSDVFPLSELVDHHLLLPHADYGSRQVFDELLRREGLSLVAYDEYDDDSTAHALASQGYGVAVNTDVPSYGVRAKAIVRDDGTTPEQLSMPLYIAWQADHHAHHELLRLTQSLRSFLSDIAQHP